ncbi:MAG TPA: hypothetical protein DCY88_11220 [Cyanobacteria bacterium UBA11372]|nr:hypothetical protein [Cyanobacteria bacterium UBA11372]
MNMNNDEYLLSMKQAIDESIKEDEKIQQFLVWLHQKTASLCSPYQEAALRAFYCDVVEGTSINSEISRRMLDSNLAKDIDDFREIANQFIYLWDNDNPVERWVYEMESREPAYSRFPEINFKRLIDRVDTSPNVDIVIDRNLALACKWETGRKIYLSQAIALLIREADGIFNKELRDFMMQLDMLNYRKKFNTIKYEIRLDQWSKRLSSCLSQYRNLKLDWQFSDEQKQLLNKYYAANKLLVDLLQENHASPEVQKEIQDTLLLPIVEIERRKSGITKKLLSIKIDFYTKTLLYSSLLIALILYIVFITVFKHYIWIL